MHLPPGEATKLGGELLRGPLCHPDPRPVQNGNCRPPEGGNDTGGFMSLCCITETFEDQLVWHLLMYILIFFTLSTVFVLLSLFMNLLFSSSIHH